MLDDELGMDERDIGRNIAPKPKTPQQELRDYLQTLPLNERRQYIANMKAITQPQAASQTQATRQPQGFQPMNEIPYTDYARHYSGMAHALQGQSLNDMAGNVMQAIQDENDSRVAQAREKRRLDYQLEMERMRQQTEQMKINALIQRLGGGGVQHPMGTAGGYSNPGEGVFIR